ncbi:hypothetical protein A6770_12100 [Nostoc minutum NIES-26]|uniref:Uncharacterized protein n=1 Tax=Nostoc minutum NIES-26 TaxID=1844469 RepID=A0A367RRL5_9NOSO|nr:hypothetical protein [Dendronalium sp. ChiSLP03b]MDZ8203183.1 hypothetical protein [Dendronalium sp. ChiSLP03b]RCJ39178.1 hypothetical protein A6770_12100 [Nostoc minutum NIES-26]
MVTLVVVINILISLILLYVAWQVWQLKQRLAFIADRLTAYERNTHAALSNAPINIYTSQRNIHNLRQGNQGLQVQIQQVRQIVSLLFLGRNVWGRSFGRRGYRFGKKTIAK